MKNLEFFAEEEREEVRNFLESYVRYSDIMEEHVRELERQIDLLDEDRENIFSSFMNDYIDKYGVGIVYDLLDEVSAAQKGGKK